MTTSLQAFINTAYTESETMEP